MKRREMINIIECILAVMPKNATNRDISCAILNKIEENGMLPPFTENNTEYATTRDADAYVWEPENEEKT
jgi:pyruvoyl-dependent arginine decarboxylase (PvlArgDC)